MSTRVHLFGLVLQVITVTDCLTIGVTIFFVLTLKMMSGESQTAPMLSSSHG